MPTVLRCYKCSQPIKPGERTITKLVTGGKKVGHEACVLNRVSVPSMAAELRRRLDKKPVMAPTVELPAAPLARIPPKPLRRIERGTPVIAPAIPAVARQREFEEVAERAAVGSATPKVVVVRARQEGKSLAQRLAWEADRQDRMEAAPATVPHLMIEARAGTGKTTTLVEGLKLVRGQASSFVPSPQQAAIWDQMKLSKDADSILFVAFNKSIAEELQKRMPLGCSAMTLHGLGYRAVLRAFPGCRPDSNRIADLIAEITETPLKELRRSNPIVLNATAKLVSLCKQNLVGYRLETFADDSSDGSWDEALTQLAMHYEVELEGQMRRVFELVPRVLEACKTLVERDRIIDFDDQPWLPIALNLPLPKNDVLLVDEAQDLNRCQQQLALRVGKRIIMCGDPCQAIYGFAGADSDSMPRMFDVLNKTPLGCVKLPLTVTRRCGRAIVEEARKIVPDFEAHESNGPGKVTQARFDGVTVCEECKGFKETFDGEPCPACDGKGIDNRQLTGGGYRASVNDGDFVLCRTNAPLVSQAIRFFREGKRVRIQGRDIGEGLITTLRKLRATTVAELVERLEAWYDAQVEKVTAAKNPSEQKLIALQDKKDCLLAFCEDQETVEEVEQRIQSVFSDTAGEGIRLSSVHRAKGLEARRVFILIPPGASMPHPAARSPWQRKQEFNLKYVGITRAIEELIWVS